MTNLAAEHRRGRLRQTGRAFEPAVADELLHCGDVDVSLLRTGVHSGGVYVDAHDVLGDAAVAVLISATDETYEKKANRIRSTSIKSHSARRLSSYEPYHSE